MKKRMKRIQASKAAASGEKIGASFPPEFASLLDYSRGLKYDHIPDYVELKRQFTDLVGQVGGKDAKGPLDWTPVGVSTPEEHNGSEIVRSEADDTESDAEDDDDDDDDDDEGNQEEDFTNSYFNWDIADWDIQGARDKSLTLPVEQVELADSSIPQIVDITK